MTATKKATTKKTAEKVSVEPAAAEETKKKRVRHTYLYAVGRRKRAIARTRLFKNGTGKITINDKDYTVFFPYFHHQQVVAQPLETASKRKEFDFTIKVQGGGVNGQAEAIRHGIARALLLIDKDLKPTLKAEGYLKRDPRQKERKKPGLKRARRAPQFSKR